MRKPIRRQFSWRASPGRQQSDRLQLPDARRSRNLPIRRKTKGQSISQPHRRRSIRLPQIDRISRPTAFTGLGKQRLRPIQTKIRQGRKIEPGKIPLAPFLRHVNHSLARRIAPEQHPPVLIDVVNRQFSRHPRHQSVVPRKIGGIKRARKSNLCSREVNVVPAGSPRQSESAFPMLSQRRPFPTQIHHRNNPTVITRRRMVDERHLIALRRNAQMADPSIRLVEHLANRILDAIAPTHFANHRQIRPVRGPVRRQNIFQHFARRSSGQRHARQRTARGERVHRMAMQHQRHFACR